MVLQELGGKLTAALQKMQSVTVISEEVLDKMLKDIAAALLEADVNVRVVGQLRKAIKTRAALEEEVAGANRRKLIQRAVVDELVNIVDPGVTPHEVKKGKPNVIMFVGLQGAGKTTTIAKFANYYQRKGFKCESAQKMNLNLTWSRRWRPRDATSRRWRLHDHMRVYASRERVAVVSRQYQSTQVLHGLRRHVSGGRLRPAQAERYEAAVSLLRELYGSRPRSNSCRGSSAI